MARYVSEYHAALGVALLLLMESCDLSHLVHNQTLCRRDRAVPQVSIPVVFGTQLAFPNVQANLPKNTPSG